jgi:hypothetical protein
VAFLGSLRGTYLGSSFSRLLIVSNPDGNEALIAKWIPQDIARWGPVGRHEMVPERGLPTRRETDHVHRRVQAVLFERLGIRRGLAEPPVAVAPDCPGGGACSYGR